LSGVKKAAAICRRVIIREGGCSSNRKGLRVNFLDADYWMLGLRGA